MSSDASVDELQQRLVTFTAQLESIHELLQADTENVELLTIAQDLIEVIRLTKETIELKQRKTSDASASANTSVSTSASTARHKESEPLASSPPEATASTSPPHDEFAPGTMCEAESKGVWFPAFIESVTTGGTYHVQYLGFGNYDDLSVTSLRRIELAEEHGALPEKTEIAVGFQCEAKYYADTQWYGAQVTAVTKLGFQVLFEGYGNSEEVPYEYLRPRRSSKPETAAAETEYAVGVSVSDAEPKAAAAEAPAAPAITKLIKIPEHLQILPTDTEAEKKRKHKRLKQLKKLNHQAEIENEGKIKQQNWKSFQNKALKRKVRGTGVLARHGASIFASPDTVEGRVGVVGSGQGMTVFEDTRKKAKRSHLESAPRNL